MRNAIIVLCLSFTAAVTGACNKEPAQESSEATKHAPANAAPGSHEDWCGEHAVPESQCTRCNPSLDRRLQGDRRLVRGARPARVAVPEVQPGPEDRAAARRPS